MSTIRIDNAAQLDDILSKSKDKLSIIDFHATWCGPCHMIAPTYVALAKQYPSVNFLKCDVDEVPDVAGRYRITAMPTFVFLKGASEVERIRGANKPALEDAVRRHASGPSTGAFSGKGQTLGNGSSSAGSEGGGGVVAFQGLNPQVKILLYLLGGYILFWWLK
ncbi:thioredoxin-like protein [Trametes punicea]|nr:thioredoxin-like protein [Trametes punicea]